MTLDPSGALLELYIDERLDQAETLRFVLPASSAKADLLVVDGELELNGRRFYVSELEQRRRGAETVVEVEAEALWYRLADIMHVGTLTITGETPTAGLAAIIAPTSWTVSTASTPATATYSLELDDPTVLEAARAWAKVTGTHLRFDTLAAEVAVTDTAGADLGLAFRYRRNLRNVRRRVRPPAVTRLYPFGADDLGIAGLNGNPYVEDLSYYTGQGLTLEQARERFTRERVWADTSFTADTALLAAAEALIAELAQPVVTYELDVVDLTELTDVDDTVNVGDTCRVADPAFAVDVRTTVVRVKRYPLEPWRNEVELAVLPKQTTDPTSTAGRSSTGDRWDIFTGPVPADYQVRNDGTYTVARIPLRFRSGGAAHYWLDLDFVGVGDGVAIFTIYDDEAEAAVRTIEVPYTDGETSTATVDWAAVDLEGAHPHRLRVTTLATGGAAPSAGIDITADPAGEARWHVHARNAVRETPTAANSQTFDYTGAVQQFTIPDNVTELTITARGGQGGGAKGGNGGEVTATFTGLTPGEVLDVYVGGQGTYNSAGGIGWPNGGATPESASGSVAGGAGGGSSDVRPAGAGLASALLVAAGGGGSSRTGSSRNSDSAQGGAGGFYAGTDGWGLSPSQTPGVARAGLGATQFAGGDSPWGGTAGSFGQGGAAAGGSNAFGFYGGGGGGGWYGGGGAGTITIFGGGIYAGDGGGGTGYVRSDGFDLELADGARTGNGQVVISWDTPA